MTAIKLQQTVLVVDDELMNIEVMNNALSEYYRVLFATSGKQALEVAHDQLPDLILLDVVMPDIDGFEVCGRLKEYPETAEIPVIFVTSKDREIDEEKGLALGAVDYTTKPINPTILKLRIKNQLELKKQRDMLADLTVLDGLTGISNRRHFDEVFEREWNRSVRSNSSLSVILVDIDHFKSYNDNYGHSAGDVCLKKVALAIDRVLVRKTDFVARYGGEEFCAVITETGVKEVQVIAEKLRKTVEVLNIKHQFSSAMPVVTISIGISTIIPSKESNRIAFFNEADKCLYKAKKNGRNRVVAKETQ